MPKIRKDLSLIPRGMYCYTFLGWSEDRYKVLPCPYWSIDKTKPPQENGYCHFLERGDWDLGGGGLLWDQVKECEINERRMVIKN